MPTVNSKTLVALTAVSTLTALGLALYILLSSSDSDKTPTPSSESQDGEGMVAPVTRNAESSPLEVKKEAKKHRHPLENHDSAYEGCIYMDYNGTTPIYTEVYESMEPYFTHYFGNPSSSHLFGPTAKRAVELARLQVAKVISCTAPYDEIIFTGCGTESDNRAIDIAIHQYLKRINHTMKSCPEHLLPEIITTPIEHPAVLCYLRQLKIQGVIRLIVVSVNAEGFVTLPEIEKALTPNTALVTVMHSNNEVGTLQPIRAISHIIMNYNKKERTKILFHSDAAQSVGKIPIDVHFLGVDMLTIVGHKFGAPKGIAILYARRNTVTEIPGLLVGGGQEKGRRGGTENVPYIVGLGTASSYAANHLLENILHLLSLKLLFLSQLQTTLQNMGYLHLVKFNGPKRSVHYQQLQEDMKVLKLLFQSNQSTNSNNTHSSSSSNNNNHASAGSSPTAPSSSTNSKMLSSNNNSNNNNVDSNRGSNGNSEQQHHHHHSHTTTHQRVCVPENSAADVLEQLPNTINVSFKGLIGHEIVSELGNKVACSAGSACHTVATTTTSAVSQPATGTFISNGDSSLLIMSTEEISAHSSNGGTPTKSNSMKLNNGGSSANRNSIKSSTINRSHSHNNSGHPTNSDAQHSHHNSSNHNMGDSVADNAQRLSWEEKKPHYVVSEVLTAMHVAEDFGLGTIRLSFGRYTTQEDIETTVKELLRVVVHMWKKKNIVYA